MSASEVLTNILPKDGIAIYYGCILSTSDASVYTNNLLHSIQWNNDEITLFGKHIITKREVAWYGNKGLEYTYSHTTKKAIPWTSELLKLKEIAEKIHTQELDLDKEKEKQDHFEKNLAYKQKQLK
ncbi:MAG: hypothetical protein HC830_12110 [Bacteroidetes bacterium]|nr:hypothetical protein [Bacteroidota bacterium]